MPGRKELRAWSWDGPQGQLLCGGNVFFHVPENPHTIHSPSTVCLFAPLMVLPLFLCRVPAAGLSELNPLLCLPPRPPISQTLHEHLCSGPCLFVGPLITSTQVSLHGSPGEKFLAILIAKDLELQHSFFSVLRTHHQGKPGGSFSSP